MTRECHDSPVEYECPHCGQGYEIGANDAIFIDDVEDECETTCDKCGGKFQLYCESIRVEMGVKSRQDFPVKTEGPEK